MTAGLESAEGRLKASPNRLLELAPGQRLGRYEIIGEIGRGGMATVFRARDVELQREVALKVLPSSVTRDERFVSRFLHEARTVARLSHPHIVQVHDIGQDRGAWYISMELIEGQNLAEYQKDETPALEQSVRIAAEIAEAIAYTHEHGVMHRDLKPSNVLMRADSPVVIDFGLSKDLALQGGAALTNEGEMIGSPAYMSPEQARGGEIDRSTDICSLGILLYELISFKNPYLDPRSFHQTVVNVIAADPVSLRQLCPWVDQDLAAVVHKAMARTRADRYSTMAAFASDLRSWLSGRPVSVRRPGLKRRLRTWATDNSRGLWIFAACVLVAGAGIVWWQIQERLSRSAWTVAVEETFDSPVPNLEFESFRMAAIGDTTPTPSNDWKVENGKLVGRAVGGLTMCRTRQEFPGDVRVEFEVTGLSGNNHDFNVFLCGEIPDEGARFYLGRNGSAESGIEAGAETRWLPHLLSLVPQKTYHVAVERDRDVLRLEVDGALVETRQLIQPLLPRGGCHLGFFTWNGQLAVDNIVVRRRAVPLRPEPTVVADAMLDIGELDRAMDAYRLVAQAYPSHPSAQESRLRLGTVLMSRHQYAQARNLILEVSRQPANADIKARSLVLLSLVDQTVGDGEQSLKSLQTLSEDEPDHPALLAGIQLQLDRMEPCLDLSQPMFYGCASDGETVLRSLARAVPSHQAMFGPQHLRFAEALRLWAGIAADSGFLRTAMQFSRYYAREAPEVAAGLTIIKARHERDNGRTDVAIQTLLKVAEGEAYPKALRAIQEAAIELGRTLAWEGHPAEAERWFKKVTENDKADADMVALAQYEWGVATVLSHRDPTARWEAVLNGTGASWILRQSVAFMAGKLDSTALKASFRGQAVASSDIPLLQALSALGHNDFGTWHTMVDEYVRRYPWYNGLWDLRRVSEWAATRTPRGPVARR